MGIRVLVLPSGPVGGGQPCSDLPSRGWEEEPTPRGFCREPRSITHLQDQRFPPGLGTERSFQLGWRLQVWGQACASEEKGACPLPGTCCAHAALEHRSQAGQTSPRGSGL